MRFFDTCVMQIVKKNSKRITSQLNVGKSEVYYLEKKPAASVITKKIRQNHENKHLSCYWKQLAKL